ncbi:MAG: hypothetical protein HYX75_19265 [Acidobacteria bacterium]|nr:hypothetical protein [Acidobacteriota bacterium]
MTYIFAPRKGWQNEHLGLFILSKISFCANPVTVSDDLGSDFFCCLFDIRGRARSRQVIPLNSFAIQIKSAATSFDVTNKVRYLSNLELPYFVGVVDQHSLRLTIYSGEWLPILFSEVGLPSRLRIVPMPRMVSLRRYYEKTAKGIRLFFPRVATITASDKTTTLQKSVHALSELCRRTHGNIATRRSEEHIYTVPTRRRVLIMAGEGSVKFFRENFYKRLAEVCFNLEWLHKYRRGGFDAGEARLYLDLIARLRKRDEPLPSYLTRIERRLRGIMTAKPGSQTHRP